MDKLSNWISFAALIVSISTFCYSLKRGISGSKLERTQLRSDLLTKIIKLKLEYEQEVNHLYYLADLAHRNNKSEAQEFIELAQKYKKFVTMTQGRYDKLMEKKTISKTKLVEMEHYIDSLRARVKVESERVKDKINGLEKSIIKNY